MLNGVFTEENKRICYEDFVHINENVTSEMFLSIITLMQTNLPCAKNFFRYKANYESGASEGKSGKPEGETKLIARPIVATKLSPVSQFVASQGINPNPDSQKHLLRYAKKTRDTATEEKKAHPGSDDSDVDDDRDYTKFQSKRMLADVKRRRE